MKRTKLHHLANQNIHHTYTRNFYKKTITKVQNKVSTMTRVHSTVDTPAQRIKNTAYTFPKNHITHFQCKIKNFSNNSPRHASLSWPGYLFQTPLPQRISASRNETVNQCGIEQLNLKQLSQTISEACISDIKKTNTPTLFFNSFTPSVRGRFFCFRTTSLYTHRNFRSHATRIQNLLLRMKFSIHTCSTCQRVFE